MEKCDASLVFGDFFRWCEEQGLTRNRDIAKAFGRTPQTVDEWRKQRMTTRMPVHLRLGCAGYEARRNETGLLVPDNPPLTLIMFDVWRGYYGLETFESTAEVFGITRQAVHHWYVRRRLPKWLNLACHGYSHEQNILHNKK